MRYPVCLLSAFLVSPLAPADVVWDTLSGSAGQSLRSSYENIGLGTQWVSVVTPVVLTSSANVSKLSIVGQHLRNDGGSFTPTDPTGSGYIIDAWSSAAAFLASPLAGDLWSASGSPSVSSIGTLSSSGFPLLRFDFSLGGALSLPSGTSFLGVHSSSLPVSVGALAWVDSTATAPAASRVLNSDPTSLVSLPRPMSLRLEAQAVPEPSSITALSLATLALIRRRRGAKPVAASRR